RLGVLLNPALLAYATGGLALGEVCGSFSYSAMLSGLGAFAVGSSKRCDTRVGYTVGGGFELALFQGWKARIEYRFTDFGDYSKNVPLTAGPSSLCFSPFNCSGNARVNLDDNNFHTIRIGIGVDL